MVFMLSISGFHEERGEQTSGESMHRTTYIRACRRFSQSLCAHLSTHACYALSLLSCYINPTSTCRRAQPDRPGGLRAPVSLGRHGGPPQGDAGHQQEPQLAGCVLCHWVLYYILEAGGEERFHVPQVCDFTCACVRAGVCAGVRAGVRARDEQSMEIRLPAHASHRAPPLFHAV